MGRFKKIAIVLMFIGLIGVTLNLVFGNNTVSYITPFRNESGILFYRYDFKSYISNITTNIADTSKLDLSLPTRTWITGEWGAVTNDIALILDYIIFGINVIIYPFRLVGYTLQCIWAILGISRNIDNTSGIYWLYKLSAFMQNIQIPYV